MKMIIGGAFQGKTEYAKSLFPDLVWIRGEDVDVDHMSGIQGILGFHEVIRRALTEGRDISSLAEEVIKANPEMLLVSDEVGYGVVPMDAFARRYREAVGRVCTDLASYSSQVTRVICGIGSVIKDER